MSRLHPHPTRFASSRPGHAVTAPACPSTPRAKPTVLALLVLAAALFLTGCSGGGDSASSSGSAGRDAGLPAGEASGAGGDELGDGDTGLPLIPEALDRQVITTGDITVRSEDVARDADRAALLVTTVGGQISGDVRGGAGEQQTADLVLRVPPAEVDGVLAGLAELGEELSRSVSSEDVTTVLADVDSRVASQQASLDRLRGLIAGATDITDLVTLERELAGRETELESLQAQQRALNDQVGLATLSLHLRAAQAPDPGAEPAGFLSGLAGGWDAFLTVGGTLLTAFGAALPFLALLALLVAAFALLRRRQRQLTPAGATEPPLTG